MEPLEGKQWKADAELARVHPAWPPLLDNVRHPMVGSYYEAELNDMTEWKLEVSDQRFGIWPARGHEMTNLTNTAARGIISEPKIAEEVERETATLVESNNGLRKKLRTSTETQLFL